jgi:hypothetical protein
VAWEQELRERVNEAFDLKDARLRQAAVDDLILAWDRHLRRHSQSLAVLRVLRSTNPQPNGGHRAA